VDSKGHLLPNATVADKVLAVLHPEVVLARSELFPHQIFSLHRDFFGSSDSESVDNDRHRSDPAVDVADESGPGVVSGLGTKILRWVQGYKA
jgi:hypothetical protein